MRALRGLLLFGAWASAGCRPSIPAQHVIPQPVPLPQPTTRPALRDGWIYRPSARQLDYIVDHVAALYVSDDSAQRTDSVSSRAEVRFAFVLPGPRISGQLLAYHVGVPGKAAAVPSALALPFPFLVSYSGADRQLRVLAPSAAPCTGPAAGVVHALRDLWFLVPDTLRIGTQWQDSSAYASCRDGVPFTTVLRRTFRVEGSRAVDGKVVVRVVRRSRSELSGEGAQGHEPVVLDGTAQGDLVYLLDVDAGEILSAEGSAVLELRLRSKVRLQLVRQASTIRVLRSP